MMKSETTENCLNNLDGTSDCIYSCDNSQPAATFSTQGQLIVNSGGSPSSSGTLRRGKWTSEEEAFALAAIRDFNSGYLDAPGGTTLRSYLSDRLQCDPMRITKKFTGDDSIGKKVFHPAVRDDPRVSQDIENSQAKLEQLYQEWKQRLEIQEQEMAQKSMAASPDSANKEYNNIQSANLRDDITKTAAWMEKACALLTKETEGNYILQKDIEDEMKEIALLVEEAPAIISVSSDLPKLLNSECNKTESTNIGLQTSIHKLNSCSDVRTLATESCTEYAQSITTATAGKRKRDLCDDGNANDSPNNPMKLLASLSSQAAPIVTKDDGNGRETRNHRVDDAKTFVNFLQSVVNK